MARRLIRATSAKGRPLVVASACDRAAMMAAAVAAAKIHQARTDSTWGDTMSVALKATWELAETARIARVH